MADNIRLEVVTPDKEVFKEMVEKFSIPAIAGSTGILYNHAPLLSALKPGVIVYHKDGEDGFIAVSNGFMELKNNVAEILVSTAERSDEIDVERAQASADRARKRLEEKPDGLDVKRAEASLHRALARLSATGYVPDFALEKDKKSK